MKVVRALGWIIVAPVLLLIAWLGSAFLYETTQTYAHHYRLTIEVDTPDGVRSGSGVWRSAWTRKADWIPQTPGSVASLRGEAVFVDLGGGRHVIAILGLGPTGTANGIESLAARAFRRDRPLWFVEAPSWEGTAELRVFDIPTLVTFADLADPTTARVVAPEEFPQVFGPGVRFKRATIEMVPAGIWPLTLLGLSGVPVTRGIEEKVPLMQQLREEAKKSRISRLGDPFRVNSGQFERGKR